MSRRHWFLSCVSSSPIPIKCMSSLTQFRHLFLGLPLLLLPWTSISLVLLPTWSSSLLSRCPYHLSLPSCTYFDISTTLVDPLIYSFLILSSLVTPDIHLNILISATPILNLAFWGGKPAQLECRSQARVNREGWCQEGHPTVKTHAKTKNGMSRNSKIEFNILNKY